MGERFPLANVQNELLQMRTRSVAWGYQPQGDPAAEPTVLSALGLLGKHSTPALRTAARTAADWLVEMQTDAGAIPVSEKITFRYWPTPHAILLWQALGGYDEPIRKAKQFLLQQAGLTFPRVPHIGHDTTIAGWAWIEHTHSWVEPTSMGVLAMRSIGMLENHRTQNGLALLRDRSLPSGGWNYGNVTVFDAELRPHPAPTGLALLALAGIDDENERIGNSCRYLSNEVANINAARSLCWSLLGLKAWNRSFPEQTQWLNRACQLARTRSDQVYQLAHVLLAANEQTLTHFGIRN